MSRRNTLATWRLLGATLLASAALTSCISDDASDDSVNDPGAVDSGSDTETLPTEGPALAGSITFTYSNGRTAFVGCTKGTFGPTRPASTWPWPSHVGNGCTSRVWLYQNADRTGISLCVSPLTNSPTLTRTYRSYKVSTTTTHC
jgi:hypothetical protein